MNTYIKYITLALVFSIVAGCAVDDSANQNAGVDNELEDKEAPQNATYKVTFIGEWTAESHPDAFPSANDHFSSMVLLTHNKRSELFEEGDLASAGIEHMAEDGFNDDLISEMQELINSDNAIDFGVGKVIAGDGTDNLVVKASQEFPQLSYVAMIAPSPDWFAGLSSISLFNDNTWVERIELDVIAYDAGTEDGKEFRYDNPETSPREVIKKITEAPLGNGSTVSPRLGRLIIELQ